MPEILKHLSAHVPEAQDLVSQQHLPAVLLLFCCDLSQCSMPAMAVVIAELFAAAMAGPTGAVATDNAIKKASRMRTAGSIGILKIGV